MDWRPCELNAAADHAANCVLSKPSDSDTLGHLDLPWCANTVELQIYSDGGFADGIEAAATVLLRIDRDTGGF